MALVYVGASVCCLIMIIIMLWNRERRRCTYRSSYSSYKTLYGGKDYTCQRNFGQSRHSFLHEGNLVLKWGEFVQAGREGGNKRRCDEELQIFLCRDSPSAVLHTDPDSLESLGIGLTTAGTTERNKQLHNIQVSMWLCNRLLFFKGTGQCIVQLDAV